MLIGRPRAPKIRTPAIPPMIFWARGGSPATFWEPLGSHSRLPALSSDIEIHRFLFDFHPRPPIFSDLQWFFLFFIDFHRFSLICIDFPSIFADFHRFSLILIDLLLIISDFHRFSSSPPNPPDPPNPSNPINPPNPLNPTNLSNLPDLPILPILPILRILNPILKASKHPVIKSSKFGTAERAERLNNKYY